MTKLFSVLFLLAISLAAFAQDLVVNHYKDKTGLHLLVPFSQYLLSAQSNSARYQLNLDLIDSDKKSAWHDAVTYTVTRDWIIDGAAHAVSRELTLKPGTYRLVSVLKNLDLGDRKERQFDLVVTEQPSEKFTNLVIAENAFCSFSPASLEQLGPDLRSCFYLLDTTVPCDSIKLKARFEAGDKTYRIEPGSVDRFDLLPLLSEGKILALEVLYYTGNIINTLDSTLFQTYDNYLSKFSVDEQLEQLRFIAAQDEWKKIRVAASKNKEQALEDYWKTHDSTPGTFKNDLRELFYERVLKADELFTIHKKIRGWRSDRGRIYIKLGPPDEILSEPFPLGEPPYIIWYYYRLNRTYRFSDKGGYGDYRLEGYYEN